MLLKQDHNQRGIAVIMALFMVAIVSAMSYAMLSSLMRDIHRTEMILRDLALTYYAEGGILWAKDHLRTNLLKKTLDKRVDIMPYRSPLDQEEGFRIITRISDMQSRYNINRLANTEKTKDSQDEFIRLLNALKINLTQKQLEELIGSIKDWLSSSEGRPDLNRYYGERPIPHRAAHQALIDVNELRLVKGMTNTLYEKLSPYLIALPDLKTSINIFTASPPVLTTLSEGVTLDKAMAISKAVELIQTGDISRIKNLAIINNLNIPDGQFVVESNYFLIETTVSIESQKLVIYTLVERKMTDEKKINVKTIWQSKGIM